MEHLQILNNAENTQNNKQDEMIISDNIEETNDFAKILEFNKSKESTLSPDSPAFILNEKNLYRNRNNSITPMMFQPHELTTNNNTHTNFDAAADETNPTISAYARLDFQNFTFYVQTLHVIIGRRSENDFTHKVDVNLGPSKSISRRHAQIFYNFGTERFELSVIGKNGAFIDDIFVESGNTVPLQNNTKIQIGQIPFQFVLPEQDPLSKLINGATSSQQQPQSSESKTKSTTAKQKKRKKAETKSPSSAATTTTTTTTTSTVPVKKEKPEKKIYTINDIPPQYRTKPALSYSALLTQCIRKFSTAKGMSLSEIYSGIKQLFPYYKYCPDGWQSSVRHNLSLNKSFRKVSKEGKGWLWGLDEEYIAERERQKKKQAQAAEAKATANQLKQDEQKRTKKATQPSGARNSSPAVKNNHDGNKQPKSISQTLAANRSTQDDHQRTMKYLQEQLIILTRDRKGLSKPVIANILTRALAMTINQVNQAAKTKNIVGNPLTALMDKNPQHLNLILAAAVNAATSKVTNGEVKQLVSIPPPNVKTQEIKPVLAKESTTTAHLSTTHSKASTPVVKATSSFDPSSLSRFFQPKQQARISVQSSLAAPKSTIPQKRAQSDSDDDDDDESGTATNSSSDTSSGSSDDDNTSSSDNSSDEDEEAANSTESAGEPAAENRKSRDGERSKEAETEVTSNLGGNVKSESSIENGQSSVDPQPIENKLHPGGIMSTAEPSTLVEDVLEKNTTENTHIDANQSPISNELIPESSDNALTKVNADKPPSEIERSSHETSASVVSTVSNSLSAEPGNVASNLSDTDNGILSKTPEGNL